MAGCGLQLDCDIFLLILFLNLFFKYSFFTSLKIGVRVRMIVELRGSTTKNVR